MSYFPAGVDATTVRSWIAEDRPLHIVDCRYSLNDPLHGWREYCVGHLPNAVYADLTRDLSGPVQPGISGRHPLPDAATLARWLGSCGVSPDHPVVVYDDGSHMFAPRLWWLLRWLGHTQVAVLEGGIRSWLASDGPLTIDLPRAASTAFPYRIDESMHVSVQDVESVVAGLRSHQCLLDARAQSRFLGLEEPIDAVAGHVPGALNLPFTRLVGEQGLPPPDQILLHLKEVLADRSAESVIVYCGSGVTACAVIWAAATVGVEGMKLFSGSWSEWIQDAKHPVATGTNI